MLRLQNNTPSVYVDKSRDFQLFLRLYDCVNNGVKFDIDTIISSLDPLDINDRMLDLLATKVGFFPKISYDAKLLRYIIESFRYIIKNKGNKTGIQSAVCCILKAENDFSTSQVLIDNDNHKILIYTSNDLYNKKALRELLEYVLPVGYTYNIERYTPIKETTTTITSNIIDQITTPTTSISQISGLSDRVAQPFTRVGDTQDNYIGTYIASSVSSSENAKLNKNKYANDGQTNAKFKRDLVDSLDASMNTKIED